MDWIHDSHSNNCWKFKYLETLGLVFHQLPILWYYHFHNGAYIILIVRQKDHFFKFFKLYTQYGNNNFLGKKQSPLLVH